MNLNRKRLKAGPKVRSRKGINWRWIGAVIGILIGLIIYLNENQEPTPFEGLEFDRPYDPKQEKHGQGIGIEDLIVKKEGGYELAPGVVQKMEEEINQLEHAEQYVLLATVADWYPCPSCMKQYGVASIFLLPGEEIRYGTSVRGEKRYSTRFYREAKCIYKVQFSGHLGACLIEEKKKIYNYVLLAENIKRDKPLRRPPQNLASN